MVDFLCLFACNIKTSLLYTQDALRSSHCVKTEYDIKCKW